MGPARTRRLSITMSSSCHTASQKTMMPTLRAKRRAPFCLSTEARASAARRSSSIRRCASASSISPWELITRTTWPCDTPSDVSMSSISRGSTPFSVAMRIMGPICESAKPCDLIICAICATRSSGRPIFAAMAEICMRGAGSPAAVAPRFPKRSFNIPQVIYLPDAVPPKASTAACASSLEAVTPSLPVPALDACSVASSKPACAKRSSIAPSGGR